MESSNVAWRLEQFDAPDEAPQLQPPERAPREPARPLVHARTRFDQRAIEIRDQGLAPFRVR